VEWEDRVGLFGAGPQDRIYTTSIDDDHKTTVVFGDGSSGARLPTGKANIVARYRQGIGRDGTLTAGQITTALDRPRGLKAVVNPVSATGGVDPESTTEARENAPNTVRTFDRAVSLRDFEDLAREFTRVDKSLATWVWTGEQRAVHVTVAGPDGVELTTAQLGDLRVYLDLRRDPNRDLLIAGYLPVDIEVDLSVRVAADRLTEEVSAAVESAIEEYFDFDERRFAQAVHLSDIYAEAQGVDGVVSAKVNVLRYELDAVAVAHGAGSEPAIVHLGIDPARPATTPHAAPSGAELAVLGSLKVSASGGLAE
jgi:predicted phage baseplate assembly protein